MATILVVDDSNLDRALTVGFLKGAGYSVLEAPSAEEAHQMAVAKSPDVILMDVMMAPINGYEATRKLAKDPLTSKIPVIMCTSKSKSTDKIWAARQGAKDYLIKPIVKNKLLAAVLKVLG